ncbi:MAG TPA: class I SAM-dependent methyltransferase [Malonomonas sp.]
MSAAAQCPLCLGQNSSAFAQDKLREYLQCTDCSLVFVPPQFHLSELREKAEYDLHRNDPLDKGYRQFLARLFEPLCERLPAQAFGLDFGCGPGPTLSLMFAEAGFRVAAYDKFYADNPALLQQNYDFISASEVVEHLRQPRVELDRLYGLLNNNGILGLMTKLVTGREAFSSWHYKNDPSHICFFSAQTFHWLAELWQARLELIGKDVILLQKID